MKTHLLHPRIRTFALFVVLTTASSSISSGSDRYIATLEMGIAGSQGKSTIKIAGSVVFLDENGAVTLRLDPSTMSVDKIDGATTPFGSFDEFEVTARPATTNDGWTLSDSGERTSGYSETLNLALGVSQVTPASLRLLKEGSGRMGYFDATTLMISESSLRVHEDPSTQWLFLRRGSTLVGIRINCKGPAADLIDSFYKEPTLDIARLVRSSNSFLRVTRLSLSQP